MQNHLFIFAGLAIVLSSALVGCEPLSFIDTPYCGYLSGQIYCYGSTSHSQTLHNQTTDSKTTNAYSLLSLYITQFSESPAGKFSSNWERIIPSAQFNTESRENATAIFLGDNHHLLVYGGGNKLLQNQTIIFDTITKTWQTGQNFTEENEVRQLYSASAVNLPNNRVGFYGGLEWNVEKSEVPGFKSMQIFDSSQGKWEAALQSPADTILHSQTATYDKTTEQVYFLGGYNGTGDNPFDFNKAYIYDGGKKIWSLQELANAPRYKIGHTANLLPNSRDIIVCGGVGPNDKKPDDYCYTLNLVNRTWTKQNVIIPTSSGSRHTTVLVDTILFVIMSKSTNPDQSIIMIDVKDVNNIDYVPSFKASTPPNNNTAPPSDINKHDGNSNSASARGPSKGAIGGIVAGIVVAVFACIVFIFCYVRNKKRRSEHKTRAQDYDEYATEKIHVTWNKTDDEYRGAPTIRPNVASSLRATNTMEATKVEPSPPVTVPTLRSHYVPNLANINVLDDDEVSVDQPQRTDTYTRP